MLYMYTDIVLYVYTYSLVQSFAQIVVVLYKPGIVVNVPVVTPTSAVLLEGVHVYSPLLSPRLSLIPEVCWSE